MGTAARAKLTANPHSWETSRGDIVGPDEKLTLAAYGPAKLEQLVAMKGRYDTSNLLRPNHDIPPA